MNHPQRIAGLYLLSLLLLSGCAAVSNGPPTTGTGGLRVVTLPDGGARLTLATDVGFAYGGDALLPAMATRLADIVAPYARPGAQARVTGYTDNVGARDYNRDLSARRAQAVAEVLLKRGFDPARVKVQGLGEDHPLASNADEAGRYRNRRVEVLISGADGK